MKILVLGASGLAGKAIVNELQNENEVFGTYCQQKDQYINDNNMFYLNIEESNSLKDILTFTDPDIIISSLTGDFDKQLQLHKLAAQYVNNKENGKLIYMSSANVYDNSVEKPHYESDVTNAASDYGLFKITCEKMLLDILKEKAIIIRVPFIWSKWAPRFLKMKEDIAMGRPVKCYRNLYCNHTTDLHIARSLHYIIKNELSGVFHIGSLDIPDYKEFIQTLLIKMQCNNYQVELEDLPGLKYYLAVISERNDLGNDLTITSDEVIDYLVD